MNLRTLKKLSRRAAAYLPRINDHRQQFPAEKDDNYTGLIIRDWNKLDRSAAAHQDMISQEMVAKIISPKSRSNDRLRYVVCRWPSAPLKRTIMVGAASGYEEPEWDETTAWEALSKWVWDQYFDYNPKTDEAFFSRRFDPRRPGEIFQAADELLAQMEAE